MHKGESISGIENIQFLLKNGLIIEITLKDIKRKGQRKTIEGRKKHHLHIVCHQYVSNTMDHPENPMVQTQRILANSEGPESIHN